MNHIYIVRLWAIFIVSYICMPAPGQSVGSIAHSFDVSPNGAATFSIPFEVLPGVGGMQPSVGITYNSQAGNGIAGWGCHLAGMPAITRVPQSIYFDGTAKGMNFDKWDGFMLNGIRLDRASLSPESDPNTTVTMQNKGDKFWFKAETADGLICHYGSNTGVYLYDTWYLDYVEDVYGNYMNYTYEVFNSCIYLKTITYGKNKQNETLNLTVNFTYENRPDHIPFRINGVFGAMERRLSKVVVKSGSDTFREYVLAYSNGDYFSRLSSVTLKNGNGETLKPTTIQWNYLPGSMNLPESNTNIAVSQPIYSPKPSYEDQEFMAFDINGDGLCDLIGIFTYDSPKKGYKEKTVFSYHASIDNGRLNFSLKDVYKDVYPLPASTSQLELKNFLSGQIVGDYEGKGVNNLCLMYYTEVSRKRYANYFVTGCEETISHEIDSGYEMTRVNPLPPFVAMADIDNDGKSEIISLENFEIADSTNRHNLRIKSSGKDWSTYRLPLGRALRPTKMFMADFNGNGMVDLMVITQVGYIIFWNTPENTQRPFLSIGRYKTEIKDCNMIRMGDFNGDGLPDFLTNDTGDANWYFALNQGNGRFEKKIACTLPGMHNQSLDDNEHDSSMDKDDDKFDCQVVDFNHDGKSDAVITKGKYVRKKDITGSWWSFNSATTKWLRSTGSQLIEEKSVTSPNEHDAYRKYIAAGDFTGDGRVEIINYGRDLKGSSTDRRWRRYKNNVTAGSGMVSSVTDGFGNITKISYSGPAEKGVCTKGTGAGYPLADVALPMAMVASVTTVHGSATNETKYNYFGPKVHLQGRGFLGMDSVIVTNITTGVATKTGVRRYHSTKYLPEETFTETTINNKTARSVVKYEYAPKTYVSALTKTETDFDQNKTTAKYEYDDGFLLKESTFFGDDMQMYREVSYSANSYSSNILLRNKPQKITVTQKHADDPNSFVQETSFGYDEKKGYVTQKKENPGTEKELTTVYSGRDIYGNITQWSVSGRGTPEIQYRREYDNGRFPKREYTFPESEKTACEYDTWGNVLKEIDETDPDNILSISHKYNGWGQRDSTTFPDGRKTEYTTNRWNNDPKKCYYTLTRTTGAPWEKKWYDRTGRVVETETVGVKGTPIKSTREYNDKGELKYTETITGGLTTREEFGYDAFGRIKTKKSSSGQDIEYEYGNRETITTVKTPEGNRTTTKTFDAWGGLKSVTDPAGTVTYTYTSTGSPRSIEAPGNAVFSMTYDEAGNQKTLTDPNAGTFTYTYDALGRMLTQKDERGITKTNEYDALGRIIRTSDNNDNWCLYQYGVTGFGKMRLTGIVSSSGVEVNYTYNRYGNLIAENRKIHHAINGYNDIESFPITYEYTPAGQLKSTTYPGQLVISNEYDDNGYLVEVKSGSQPVWTLNNVTGLTTTASLAGGSMTVQSTRDAKGLLTNLKTVKGNKSIRNFEYIFDGATGNLTSRKGMAGSDENFFYDHVNRLNSVKHGSTQAMTMEYFPNGNIKSKTGLGNFYYDTEYAGPHALVGVENTSGLINHRGQKVGYTSFGKVAWVIDTIGTDAYRLDITYGPDQQRFKTVLEKNGNVVKSVIFVGDYERITENGLTRELYYIGGNAIVVKNDGVSTLYYVHPDHLGSFAVITDVQGNIVQKCTYDAWGNRKFVVKDPELTFDRGYTGHEHLDEFGLINMNGRMYDPVVGRFLSPDPYVQAPEFSQSYNRYSYCLNNPLIYTDPSGENPLLIYLLFFTDAGYNVQKAISPVAFKVDLHLGSNQGGIGFDFSYGIPSLTPVSYRAHQGKTYYWKYNDLMGNDLSGWETRKGGEWSILSGMYTYGGTTYNSDWSGEQTTNYHKLRLPGIALHYQNDMPPKSFLANLPGVPNGDGDRYRTASAKIKLGGFFEIGTQMITGDGGFERRNNYYRIDENGNKIYIPYDEYNPNTHRTGLFYFKAGPISIGRNSEQIRHVFQNRFAHDFITGGQTKWFEVLTLKPRWFWQIGGSGLW